MIHDPAFKGRVVGRLKVTGSAIFAAETYMPNLLHAALVEVPIARGEVLAVETTAARSCPGVVDVVGVTEAVALLRPIGALKLIVEPHIHFAGQVVALVAAETSEQAKDGAAAVHVHWNEAPPIVGLEACLADAYTPETCGGRGKAATLRGDPAAAIASAAAVVRARYTTAANNHHPMEPHAVVCAWTQTEEGERLVVHTCTQAVFGTRAVIAHALGLPRVNATKPAWPVVSLAVLTGLNLLDYLDRQLLAAVLPPLQAELHLGDEQAGNIATAFMLGYFLTAPIFGYLGDRLPRRWLIGAGVFVWSLGTLLSGHAHAYVSLILFHKQK